MGGVRFEIESDILEQAAQQAIERRRMFGNQNIESSETSIAP